MRVHHLNCASMTPILPRVTHGKVPKPLQKLVSHCLLVEGRDGLTLIDTGFSKQDFEPGRLERSFKWLAKPVLDVEETAISQIRALGFNPTDVRHIICTHLDLDHAGGLVDFPHAHVHVLEAEHAAAIKPVGIDRKRYKPYQWAHGVKWALHPAVGEPWHGFAAVRDIPGIPPEVLLIPTIGHTRGHLAVAIDGPDGWMLHAGDAYYHRGSIEPAKGPVPFGLRLFERFTQTDAKQLRANQSRLTTLAAEGTVQVFCAHDAAEFAACAAHHA